VVDQSPCSTDHPITSTIKMSTRPLDASKPVYPGIVSDGPWFLFLLN
jgi:hypothetical protein